jgi:hypothetical protein
MKSMCYKQAFGPTLGRPQQGLKTQLVDGMWHFFPKNYLLRTVKDKYMQQIARVNTMEVH